MSRPSSRRPADGDESRFLPLPVMRPGSFTGTSAMPAAASWGFTLCPGLPASRCCAGLSLTYTRTRRNNLTECNGSGDLHGRKLDRKGKMQLSVGVTYSCPRCGKERPRSCARRKECAVCMLGRSVTSAA